MTDNAKGTGGPLGPPWSVDVLADLHAGVLDEQESAALWPQVNADPQARAVLHALDSVKVDLGQLASAPVEPMPSQFAERLDAALRQESQRAGQTAAPATAPPASAPVIDFAEARRRRNRRMGWGVGVLTAAAAAVAIAVVAIPQDTTGGTPQAGQTPTATDNDGAAGEAPEQPLALSRDDLRPAISGLTGEQDYGSLDDQQGVAECLGAHDIELPGDPIGVGPVSLDGQEGIGMLVRSGPTQFRLVIVEPTCTADDPGALILNEPLG